MQSWGIWSSWSGSSILRASWKLSWHWKMCNNEKTWVQQRENWTKFQKVKFGGSVTGWFNSTLHSWTGSCSWIVMYRRRTSACPTTRVKLGSTGFKIFLPLSIFKIRSWCSGLNQIAVRLRRWSWFRFLMASCCCAFDRKLWIVVICVAVVLMGEKVRGLRRSA